MAGVGGGGGGADAGTDADGVDTVAPAADVATPIAPPDAAGFELFDGPADVFNAISMLLKAAETWYKFSIKIL